MEVKSTCAPCSLVLSWSETCFCGNKWPAAMQSIFVDLFIWVFDIILHRYSNVAGQLLWKRYFVPQKSNSLLYRCFFLKYILYFCLSQAVFIIVWSLFTYFNQTVRAVEVMITRARCLSGLCTFSCWPMTKKIEDRENSTDFLKSDAMFHSQTSFYHLCCASIILWCVLRWIHGVWNFRA